MSGLRQSQNNQRYGYYHLETDDEVIARLRESPIWKQMVPRNINDSFDLWLESYGQARKLIYIA